MVKYFPDFDVEVVDIQPLIRRRRLTSAINGLHTLWLYSRNILSGRLRFRACFWRTPYIHRAIQKLVRTQYGQSDWAFTFQIQSIFDGSIPGIPHFVYTDHTHLANLEYPTFDPGDLYHADWISCEREIYANSDIVLVWSTNMVRVLVDEYAIDTDKVRCVFAGPNSDVPDRLEAARRDRQARNILFVGVDWQRKGGPDLLSAFSSVRDRIPDAHATIVSAYAPASSEWPPGVTFTGKVPLSGIAEYFEHADIFCLPTYVEPFGIVFIEAMAYGLPIISTRVGALPDLVEVDKNGYLIEPGQTQELSEYLLTLLTNDRIFAAMSHESRSRYDTLFNWATIFANIRNLIDTSITGDSSGTTNQASEQ